MAKQQILLVNDMAGHSKVGMGAMIPIFSYLGYPTFNLPTALVSNTFDYGRFNILDTTDYIRGTLPVWKQLGFSYDAVCTGCMFTEEQVRLVADYCRELKEEKGSTVFVDPVMGDGGHLYNGMTEHNVELMRMMVGVADLTFPNFTEAALLTGHAFRPEGISPEEASDMLDDLQKLGCGAALITSCIVDGQNCVVGRSAISETFLLPYEEIPGLFHGTGDLFSAILIAQLLNGKPLKDSTRKAMDVVYRLIDRNRNLPDRNRGILIEQFLDELD